MTEPAKPVWERGVRTDPNRGPGIRTYRGWFYPLTPRANEVDILDIAHALAMICRFGGHVCDFYSVAQHSVLVSHHVPPDMAVIGLLHDATEAYVGDMVAPIKRQLPEYRAIEDDVWAAIVEAFSLCDHGVDPKSLAMPPQVKEMDLRALVTEMRDLWRGQQPRFAVRDNVWPLAPVIRPLDWRAAEIAFLNRWHELTDESSLR